MQTITFGGKTISLPNSLGEFINWGAFLSFFAAVLAVILHQPAYRRKEIIAPAAAYRAEDSNTQPAQGSNVDMDKLTAKQKAGLLTYFLHIMSSNKG
jgi:hypothetical protein